MSDSNTFESGQNLSELATVFNLFGRVWLREIDESFLLQLQTCETELQTCGVATHELQVDQLSRLAVDYCQLLIGPRGAISPLQSVAETGLMEGDVVASMREMLAYQKRTVCDTVMVDHLGFQLQTMGGILESVTQSASENQDDLRHYAETFFAQHLAWGRAWSRRVAKQAQTDFYRSAASVTEKLIDDGV